MKPLAKIIIAGALIVFLTGAVIVGAIVTNAMGGETVDDTPDDIQEPTPEPTPTATADPVEQCLTPVPAVGDGPGTTDLKINDRPVQSDAVENRLSDSLLTSNTDEFQNTDVNENMSVVARQHAEAAAGGNTYDYTVADGCELNTMSATVLDSDISSPSSASIADSLQSELTTADLETIRADHDAVGIGVYMSNGVIHMSVVTLDHNE